MRQVTAYYRVSTAAQGRSALGLEAQREAVTRFVAAEGFELLGEHIEVETGKGSDALNRRPVLRAAMEQARKAKAAVCVAKLDRLSRDVAFISVHTPHPSISRAWRLTPPAMGQLKSLGWLRVYPTRNFPPLPSQYILG